MTITELREKRATTWNLMEKFLDSHRNEQGVLSVEDDAIYTKMEKELETYFVYSGNGYFIYTRNKWKNE